MCAHYYFIAVMIGKSATFENVHFHENELVLKKIFVIQNQTKTHTVF